MSRAEAGPERYPRRLPRDEDTKTVSPCPWRNNALTAPRVPKTFARDPGRTGDGEVAAPSQKRPGPPTTGSPLPVGPQECYR